MSQFYITFCNKGFGKVLVQLLPNKKYIYLSNYLPKNKKYKIIKKKSGKVGFYFYF